MVQLTVFAVSDEPNRTRAATEAAVSCLRDPSAVWTTAVPDAGPLIIVVDDPKHAALSDVLRRARGRVRPDDILLLGWGCGQGWVEGMRHWVGGAWCLPEERQPASAAIVRWLRSKGERSVWNPKLPEGRPFSLDLALRNLIAACDGSSPPARNISLLAERERLNRSNLSRQAQRHGIDLGKVCELAFLRWLLLQPPPRTPREAAELSKRAGFGSSGGLRQWVKRVTGRPLGRLHSLGVEQLEARMSDLVSGRSRPD